MFIQKYNWRGLSILVAMPDRIEIDEIDEKTYQLRPHDGQARARRFAADRWTFLRAATLSAVTMTTRLTECDTPAYEGALDEPQNQPNLNW